MRETTNFFEIKVVLTVNIVKKKVFNVSNDEVRPSETLLNSWT